MPNPMEDRKEAVARAQMEKTEQDALEARMEPGLTKFDTVTSVAISMKRIADAFEEMVRLMQKTV